MTRMGDPRRRSWPLEAITTPDRNHKFFRFPQDAALRLRYGNSTSRRAGWNAEKGWKMQRIALVSLAALLISATMAAQQAPVLQATPSAKAATISGTVSNDGKTLVSQQDDEWTVSNPDVLKGQEGRPVTVKCRPDPARRSIHVFFVKPGETRYLANRGDSAFRR
jgi:hypothetical protein